MCEQVTNVAASWDESIERMCEKLDRPAESQLALAERHANDGSNDLLPSAEDATAWNDWAEYWSAVSAETENRRRGETPCYAEASIDAAEKTRERFDADVAILSR